ncbi:tandem-95 repeat protein [Salinibacterium sp. dk2585]|uniref:Ig-like domain-containing protein n=1 Tax=unclassified Salinibacterium TaxID=2632331 RepID=UPI0011C24AA7|nr:MULTISPECIES: Ig-like domain-containing protein [unclassified Salinibacterium]QEE60940.1 tandem-95 repeat protein [Salinibacterium sp. dk2585]TXK56011.1 tandem-95 repeat protein [Salinibacterium sp. dk5596]
MVRPRFATRTRKTVASTLVFAIIAGVPLAVAALHPGFPVSDVELASRDVWVTNGEQLMGGRLNRQIDELNGSVVASTSDFDVMQHGDTLFMHDPVAGRVESVDPASTQVTSAIEVPKGAEVAFGGEVLAILAPSGELWAIPAIGDLQFNQVSQPPIAELGTDSHVTVSREGIVLAVSSSQKTLYRLESIAELPVESEFPQMGEFQLTAVGDRAIAFDQTTNELVTDDGKVFDLGEEDGLRLQQVSAASDHALVATGRSLLRVNLGSGEVEEIAAGVETTVTSPQQVAAPVSLDGCAHGAWAGPGRYLLACDGEEPAPAQIDEPTSGSRLEFRVNRSVIALNDLDNGNVWLVDENMRLVNNWDDVTPPEEEETEEIGDEKSAIQSFEDTLAERTENNRPPTANDDDFGIRPGRTTILPLLDNDTDPDGDVLVISQYDQISESTGRIDPIDGSRALQFTPAPGFVGSVAINYTVDDGRGGTDTARVTLRVVPDESNEVPIEVRLGGVSVEANQEVKYNVLTNWRDPDGDDLFLIGASPKSGDLVRFTPDGIVTFTHRTSELGEKEVVFQVTDGRDAAVTGTLVVTVEPPGTLNPVGTPDFAETFVDETVELKPTDNDLSPSGAPLSLVAIEEPGGSTTARFSADTGTLSFSASSPGIHYVKYTVAAGATTSVGIVRINVLERPADDDLPPVAVKDVAYLRGEEPTTVSVLSNDVSPSGRVLAVQSVSVPAEYRAKGLVVELLASTSIRVTSPAALTTQASFTYTVSDGVSTASAGVSVVPVPALTKHQPPVADNDTARVRVGDIVTVEVLENDTHPDDSPMFLAPELISEPSAGIAFVSQNTVRFQAPREPGEYRADYRVLDPFGETAAATVIFTVVAEDEENNQDPEPRPLVARVLAGNAIRVDLPLNHIDPDGDSTQLLNFPRNPQLGTVTETGADYFYYESSPAASGTDVFSYEVYDAFGATGVGEIKIAVIPPPDELQDPTAVPDSVSIRPGRLAQVDLMANDSDPQGARIEVSEELTDVPEGIEAEVLENRYLVIRAPEEEQSFTIRYELSNNRGGSAMSYVLVQVTPDAPLLPPTALDLPILTKDIAGEESITVDVLDGYAFNPAGPNDDLVVSVEGPNADSATLLERNGQIRVTPGEKRQAIAYRVTNEADELSALAFILVPAAVEEGYDDPPYIDPNLPVQYVSMNETREWDLADIVKVPSGRDAWIPDASTVTAIQSNGQSSFVDKDTLRFTPALDYRGPAAINFTVTDGASLNDPKGITANLTLNIVVGDPEFRDMPPEFTTPSPQVEVGEVTTIDLRASTAHQNPQILQEVTYSDITGQRSGLEANLRGSELSLTVPRNTPKGTTMTLGVTLRWDKFEVPGTINVTVVGSTKPLAVAVSDTLEMKRGGGDGGGSITSQPLANDANPFASTNEPLKIVDARVSNTGEPATISHTGTSVKITPSPSLKSGVVEVIYTVEDATEDRDRHVNGTITLTVSDVPDEVQKPTVPTQGDEGTVTIGFAAPASNGKPITSYEVSASPNASTPSTCAPPSCTITGLNNGTSYTFSVRAINEHGPGAWSTPSNPVIPYGTPSTPSVTISVVDQWAPGGAVSAAWNNVTPNGGSVNYRWQLLRNGSAEGRPWNDTAGTSTGSITGLAAGSYSVQVIATNSGGKSSQTGTSPAGTLTAQGLPPAPGGLGARVSDSVAPGSITWHWNAVSASPGGQANLSYEVNFGNGWTGVGTRTEYTRNNLSEGTYSLSVRAVNKAGAGAPAGPANGRIDAPPPPPKNPTVHLERGNKVGAGAAGCTGGNCHFYDVTLSDFPGGTHTLEVHCNSNTPFRTYTFTGNRYTTSPSGAYCGENRAWVVVDGVRSNTVDFLP